jgi:hypothetical protein
MARHPLPLVFFLLSGLCFACSDSDTGAPDSSASIDAAMVDVTSGSDATISDAAAIDADSADTSGPDISETGFAYLVVEPTALAFGEWPVGSVETRDLELENAGIKALTLNTIAFIDGSGAFATNLQQTVLAPGEKRSIKVTFYAEVEGEHNDTLRFESNAINGAYIDVPIHGIAKIPVCGDLDGDGHGIHCAPGGDCNESDPTVYVGAPELCNGLDDDCDGLHDEDFVGLGSACEVGFGACVTAGTKICAGDEQTLNCSVNPVTGGSELCNELDDDCDGATDEDFPSKGKLCSVGVGACAAYDKFICSEDGTSLICNVFPGEPTLEVCEDGIDNDCDGIVDEGNIEVCDDGIDNDCDGLTDESGSAWGELFFARSHYGQTVAITPANGDGTFKDPIPLTFPDNNHYSVHSVGDFDGDKYLDLIVVQALVGDQDICTSTADCPGGQRCSYGVCHFKCANDAQCPGDMKCIDHHPQGKNDDTFCVPPRDIFLARSSCEGDGIELNKLFVLEPGETLGPVIDADGNGHLDFAILLNWSIAKGKMWMSAGDGTFQLKENSFDYGDMLSWIYAMVKTSKDLTGDGIVDMLGKRFDSGGSPPTKLYLFVGKGDGTFEAPVLMSQKFPMPVNLVTADDFDGDGDQDIIGGLDDDGKPGSAWILLNLDAPAGTDWVSPYEVVDVTPSINGGGDKPGVGNGTSYDFDGDNLPDVLAAWTPEECLGSVWTCSQIVDPNNICYGGSCRKVGYIRNNTATACVPGTSCIDGQCQAGCTADCTNKQCGSDGCGGSCGECGGGQLCASGQCVVDCIPDCGGKECGDNGCGGICGACAQGLSCLQGQCQAGCVPNCAGKSCGDDGCGGSCVVFDPPQVLTFDDNRYTNVTAPANVPPTKPEIAIDVPAPTPSDTLECVITKPSYDLDAVTYRYRWYRDGAFAKDLGEKSILPAALTATGETWVCKVRATDGIEWSPQVETSVTIGEEGAP